MLNLQCQAHVHLLVRATSEQFLPAEATFRVGLASDSQWLQPMLVLAVHWWPTPVIVGGLLVVAIVGSPHPWAPPQVHPIRRAPNQGAPIPCARLYEHLVLLTTIMATF
jgi:hypothetical protein